MLGLLCARGCRLGWIGGFSKADIQPAEEWVHFWGHVIGGLACRETYLENAKLLASSTCYASDGLIC